MIFAVAGFPPLDNGGGFFGARSKSAAAIPEYADYGFALFQLKNLSGAPHPIGFEFKTRMRNSELPNKDTWIDLTAVHASSGCGRCDMTPGASTPRLGPASVALAGLAWLIRRRNTLRR